MTLLQGGPRSRRRAGPHPIRFRSPLRGPWLTSVFAAVLLAALPLVVITGLLDYVAYGPRTEHPRRRRLAAPADLRLAHPPVVAVPVDPGAARRAGAGRRPGRGGEALVGHPEAVHLAAGAHACAVARARVAAAARRQHPLRDRHRTAQHPVRLRVRFQLLHRALPGGVGVHRRVRHPRLPQAAHDGPVAALPIPACRTAHAARRHPARGARRRDRARPGRTRGTHDEPAGSACPRRRRGAVRRRADGRADGLAARCVPSRYCSPAVATPAAPMPEPTTSR